jgi:hypothetical protein
MFGRMARRVIEIDEVTPEIQGMLRTEEKQGGKRLFGSCPRIYPEALVMRMNRRT